MEETRVLIDALAEHLIFYKKTLFRIQRNPERPSEKVENNREVLYNWFDSLSIQKRSITLTCTDEGFVRNVREMQITQGKRKGKARFRHGNVYFSVNPPCYERSSSSHRGRKKVKHLDRIFSKDDQKELAALGLSGLGILDDQDVSFDVSTPQQSKAGDALQTEWDTETIEACSQLEKKALLNLSGQSSLVFEDTLLSNSQELFSLMVKISRGRFGHQPLTNKECLNSWTEFQWLQSLHKYPLGAYLCNQVEVLLWRGYLQQLNESRTQCPWHAERKSAADLRNSRSDFEEFWSSISERKQKELLVTHTVKTLKSLFKTKQPAELKHYLEHDVNLRSKSPLEAANDSLSVLKLQNDTAKLQILCSWSENYELEINKSKPPTAPQFSEKVMFVSLKDVGSLFEILKKGLFSALNEARSEFASQKMMNECIANDAKGVLKSQEVFQKKKRKRKKRKSRTRAKIGPSENSETHNRVPNDSRKPVISNQDPMLGANACPLQLRGHALRLRQRAQVIALQIVNEIVDLVFWSGNPCVCFDIPIPEELVDDVSVPKSGNKRTGREMQGVVNDTSHETCYDTQRAKANDCEDSFSSKMLNEAEPLLSTLLSDWPRNISFLESQLSRIHGSRKGGNDSASPFLDEKSMMMMIEDCNFLDPLNLETRESMNQTENQAQTGELIEETHDIFNNCFGGSGLFSWRPAQSSRLSNSGVFSGLFDEDMEKETNDKQLEVTALISDTDISTSPEPNDSSPTFDDSFRRHSVQDFRKLDAIQEVPDSGDDSCSLCTPSALSHKTLEPFPLTEDESIPTTSQPNIASPSEEDAPMASHQPLCQGSPANSFHSASPLKPELSLEPSSSGDHSSHGDPEPIAKFPFGMDALTVTQEVSPDVSTQSSPKYVSTPPYGHPQRPWSSESSRTDAMNSSTQECVSTTPKSTESWKSDNPSIGAIRRLEEDNVLLRDMCLRLEAEVAKYRNLVSTQQAGIQAAASSTQGPLAARMVVGSPMVLPNHAFRSTSFQRQQCRAPYLDTMSDDGALTPVSWHAPTLPHLLRNPHLPAYRGVFTPESMMHCPMTENVLPPYVQPQLEEPQRSLASELEHKADATDRDSSNTETMANSSDCGADLSIKEASLLSLSTGFGAVRASNSLRSRLCEDMFRLLSIIKHEEQRRWDLKITAFQKCKGVVRRLWPRAQVYIYGSFSTGLSLPSSDLDLVICLPKVCKDTPAVAPGDLEGRNAIKETWQQNLARYFRLENWVINESIKIISQTAIPVIKLATHPQGLQESRKDSTGSGNGRSKNGRKEGIAYSINFDGPVPPIELDISFEDPGHQGLEANQMVISLLEEFPSIRPIVLVNKLFLKKRGLLVVYTGGLSSYALVLMAAKYLQEQQQQMDTGSLLMGFLDFYGNHFDPRTIGISVRRRCYFSRQAGGLPASFYQESTHVRSCYQGPHLHNNPHILDRRNSFGDGIPAAQPPNVNNMDEMQVPYKFDPLFVEDPLCTGNNVGRNCFRVSQVQRAWSDAFRMLTAALDKDIVNNPSEDSLLKYMIEETELEQIY